jgi:class 3 adenylate cyclase/tetratricopeptide (TPR) repeat protein
MRCPNCHTENRATAKFCESCGSPIPPGCPSCGASLRPSARFCDNCGTPLADASSASPAARAQPATPTPAGETAGAGPGVEAPAASAASTVAVTHRASPADGERRHLTVLFCDLVGSTELSSKLDPEEWRELMASYHRAAAEAITRYGGHVAKYLGDGVMAFFGYPEAHDNDAERAVRSGLAMLDALAALNESSAHPRLAARIGIDSGAVVVGSGAGRDADVFGDTPNIAARVQASAEPDTVVVTGASQRLIHGLFIIEDRGAGALKGIAEPLQLFRIVRPSGARGRLEASASSRGLTSFVGRDDELRLLTSRWERARDGEGQAVLIIGEAGIGKSRLLHRFRETLGGSPHSWIDSAAGAFFQNTPFYPVTELLRQLVWVQSLNRLDDYLRNLKTGDQNDGANDSAHGAEVPDEPFAQLLSGLAQAGVSPAVAIPLLAPLLNLALPPDYAPSPLPPEQQRRRLLATLVEWILGTARVQPLIIATEDLHWADPSTLELIQLLVEQGNSAPLMLLYTARPEFRPPWQLRSHHAQINLNRLSARDVRTIVAQVAAQKALADETVTAVVERTGGVPLFVEELTRVLLERGDARPTGREIPATLHDSLIARLDRLGPARETLQIAAVLGSDFSYELLHAVHPAHGHEELQRHLRTLTDAELLYVRGLAPDATYQFKHVLIRDAAYEALLKSRRKELHRLVAQTIDSQFATLKENHPEVLAHHWTEGGEIEPAIAGWREAGDRALTREANREAVQHYHAAISLLPPTDDARRCALLFALGRAQRRAGEVIEAHDSLRRSGEIAERLGMPESVSAAGLEMVRLTITLGLPGESTAELLEYALAAVGPTESILRAKILGGLGTVLAFTERLESATDFAESGVAMSRRLGDPDALILNLSAMHYCLNEPQNLDRRLACLKEAIDFGKGRSDGRSPDFKEQLMELRAHFVRHLHEAGDLAAADAEFETWAKAETVRERPFFQYIIAGRRAARALMRGEFEQSEKLAQTALNLGQQLRADNVAAGLFGLQMFALERERGRLKELEPLVRLFLQQSSAAETWRPGLAVIYSEIGRAEEARAEFEHLAAHDFEDVPRDALWIGSMTFLTDVCVFLRDQARAAILYKLLAPFAGRNTVIGYEVVCYGALTRYLGALATTLERWDDAGRHFEDALTMNARMEAWPWLAHTQHQYAGMLLARGASSDRGRAFALLDSAQATARRLGMRALEEKVSAVLNRQA